MSSVMPKSNYRMTFPRVWVSEARHRGYSPLPWGEGGEPGEGLPRQVRLFDPPLTRNRPLTRPAPAGESAGSGTPSPQGRGQDSHIRNLSQPPVGLRLRLPLLARPNLFGGD